MRSHFRSLFLLTLIAATASAAEGCGPGCAPGDAPTTAPAAGACAPAAVPATAPVAAPAPPNPAPAAAVPAAPAPQRRTLAALLDAPESQRDVPIILEGHFVNVCCAGCFTYKEGVDAIEVRTTVTGWERYAAGTPVRLQGSLRVVGKRTAAGGTQKLLHIEATSVETR